MLSMYQIPSRLSVSTSLRRSSMVQSIPDIVRLKESVQLIASFESKQSPQLCFGDSLLCQSDDEVLRLSTRIFAINLRS